MVIHQLTMAKHGRYQQEGSLGCVLCRQIDLLSIVLKAEVGMGTSNHWDKTNIHPLQWSMKQFLVLYPAPGRSFALTVVGPPSNNYHW